MGTMPGPDGNERLTAASGAVLFLLLAAEGVTILSIGQLLSPHLFIGMLLIPPVALKLASTGWRFARYYGARASTRRRARRSCLFGCSRPWSLPRPSPSSRPASRCSCSGRRVAASCSRSTRRASSSGSPPRGSTSSPTSGACRGWPLRIGARARPRSPARLHAACSSVARSPPARSSPSPPCNTRARGCISEATAGSQPVLGFRCSHGKGERGRHPHGEHRCADACTSRCAARAPSFPRLDARARERGRDLLAVGERRQPLRDDDRLT